MKNFKLKESIFAQVLLALVLGIACGLFFGEPAGRLQVIGDAYVRLLLMTVLPFVVAALVSGIGRLNPAWAGRIGLRAAALMIVLWVVSIATVLVIPLAYPPWESGSYFSATLLEAAQTFNPVTAYLPINIFESLASMQVPAVVVFCVALGVALIQVSGKEALMQICQNLIDALGRIAGIVVKLAPIGIFAIAASSAGTLRMEELDRLQVFFGTFLVASLVLAFWTLPVLVAAATPIRYRDVVGHALVAMLTAFATGTVLVVLPLIAESCKKLLAEQRLESEETSSTIDVMVPAAYSLPSAGTILGLSFILFGAWYVGSPLSAAQYSGFSLVAGMSAFGGMTVALPYLLDFYRLPADLFQLYLLASVFTVRLATGLAAMHGVVISLLVASAVTGRLSWRRLTHAAFAGIALAAVLLWLSGFAFRALVPHESDASRKFLSATLSEGMAVVNLAKHAPPLPEADRQRDRLAVIEKRKTLRVGVLPDTLPFVYSNLQGELIGFDMQLLHDLAGDLDVTLEVAPVDWSQRGELLASGSIDLLAGGIAITPDNVNFGTFPEPYLEQSAALLVVDHRRGEFTDLESIRAMKKLKIAVPNEYYMRRLRRALPNAQSVFIDNIEDYLKGELPDVDALLYTAEAGSAWTFLYPQYSVVVPEGLRIKVPTGFLIPRDNERFYDFMNTWLLLKIKNGQVADAYDQWILGKKRGGKEPRWSVIRNVLHWVD
jgi:Na+/H+-dicarboxylate symporter/ABC-type amino acid transport substrate-binding protein